MRSLLALFTVCLFIASCGGQSPTLRRGSAEMGLIGARAYASMEASGSLGGGYLDVTTDASWAPNEPFLLDGLLWLTIKGLLRVGVEYECVFDDSPSCDVCFLFGGGRLCFPLPTASTTVPEKPNEPGR